MTDPASQTELAPNTLHETQSAQAPQSVYAVLAQAAKRWPIRDVLNVLPATASVYGMAAGTISYQSLLADTDELSIRFSQAGYQRGMRVALLLENRPVFFIAWLALNKLGVSVVPINPDLRASELQYLIGHAEPALIISVSTRVAELKDAATVTGITLDVISSDVISSDVINGVEQIPSPRPGAIVAQLSYELQEQEAAVLYTSGTTGNPKGCVLPNTYYLLAGDWYATVGGLATLSTDGERMITPLPLFHMNAMAYSFMAMLSVGGCLCVLDRFHPKTWWADVKASNATCLHYLGVMPSMLMGMDATAKDTAHTVRFGFGAGVDPELHASFEKRFGFPLIEAWAMTETGAGAVVAASTTDRLVGESCLGQFAKDIECRLIDENNLDVESGQPGQLLVRRAGKDPRHGFFSSYYKDEKATNAAWQGGWFHTGDMVRRDAAGNLFFIDRKKNVIRRSGENIAAVEVESMLMRHGAIKAAGVTAVPDPVRGDEVFACLQVDSPGKTQAFEIVEWCLTRMAYYKAPGYIAFVDALPLTGTQKIQRAALKAQAIALLDDADTVSTVHLKKRHVPA